MARITIEDLKQQLADAKDERSILQEQLAEARETVASLGADLEQILKEHRLAAEMNRKLARIGRDLSCKVEGFRTKQMRELDEVLVYCRIADADIADAEDLPF